MSFELEEPSSDGLCRRFACSMSHFGTFETCRRSLRTSVRRGRPEVIGGRSKRREWTRSGHAAQADLSNECSLLNPLRRRRMNLSGRDVFPARASSRSFAACNEATALCRPPHWPRPILEPSVFLPTMSGAGGPCAHTWFGDRSPGIRMSVWGRWHPLRPQTSWVGRLLAGELTPKLAAEALQRLGTPGRALRDH